MFDITVSVVIPVKDRKDVLLRAVDSVFKQTYKVKEIIIVDDASTDGTVELVEELVFREPSVKLIKNNFNKGAPFSRNVGSSVALGSHIAFLDSDDKWLPTKIEKQVELLKKNKAKAVFTNFKFIRGNKISVGKVKPVVILSDLFGRNVLGGTSSVLVDKDLYNSVEGFTDGLLSCQDWDLWLKLAMKVKLYSVDEALVEYYVDADNRISTNSNRAIDGHKYIFMKIRKIMDDCGSGYSRKVSAQQNLRMAEIYIKNLNQKRNGFKCMCKSFFLFPSFSILFSLLKLNYFLIK